MFHRTVHFTLRSWVCLLFCGVVLLADVKPPMLHYRTSYFGVYPLFAFSLGKSKALILGGYQLKDDGGMAPTTAVEMYDYKGPGKKLAAIPFTVSVATQLSDGSVLACDSNIYGSSSNCAIYRDAKDEWQILDRPRGAGIYPVLTALSNGSALMGGGYFPAGPAGISYGKEFYLLDPASLRWQRVADAPDDLGGSKVVLMTDGRTFFIGGTNTWTVKIFDPGSNRWSTLGSTPNLAYSRSPLSLPGNKVLVLNSFNASQIYDATNNNWTPVPNLHFSSSDCTMTLLPNGQVLLAGGYQYLTDTPSVVADTLVFDPQSGAVRQGAPLVMARANHAAVALPDGEVLIAGGDVQRFQYQLVLGQSPLASITDSVESFPWEPSFRGTLDPGYYIATVNQTAWGRGGLWGIEVRSSGRLDGGLNLGGFLDAHDVEVGFGGFYIDFPQAVTAVANLQLARLSPPQSQGNGPLSANLRILDAKKNTVAGPVQANGHLELSQNLQPGFYSVEIHSDPKSDSPAAFDMAITAPQLTGGGSAGALISRNAGVSGFVGFYLSTRQDVDITLFNQNTYGFPRGAGEVILGLKDSTGKVIFQAGPGVMK